MKRIKTIHQLRDAALDRKAVVMPWSHGLAKPHPAAFAINFQGHVLAQMLERGMYMVDQKEKNGKRQ